jgi:hypothetical protein
MEKVSLPKMELDGAGKVLAAFLTFTVILFMSFYIAVLIDQPVRVMVATFIVWLAARVIYPRVCERVKEL